MQVPVLLFNTYSADISEYSMPKNVLSIVEQENEFGQAPVLKKPASGCIQMAAIRWAAAEPAS